MTKNEIDEIEKKAKAASQGLWYIDEEKRLRHDYGYICEDRLLDKDLNHIASMSPDVTLKLIAHVRRLEKALKECEGCGYDKEGT